MITMIDFICGNSEKELKKIESESVNLVYTDPPYEMAYFTNIPGDSRWNATGKTDGRFGILPGDKGGLDWKLIWEECYRVLKNNSFIFIHVNVPFIMNYGNLIKEAGFKHKGTICWNKKFAIGGDLKGSMKKDWEPILYFTKGKPVLNPIEVMRKGKLESKKRISEIGDWVFSLKKKEKIGHPTQKPVALAKQILKLASNEGGVVLDPFAGSGSVGLAAKELGRDAILIEVSEKFEDLFNLRKGEGK